MTVESPAEAPAGQTTTPLKGIRKVAARRMVEAWAVPVFHLTIDVDMTYALTTRQRVPGATVTDALLGACAAALRTQPALNAHCDGDAVTVFDEVNLGVAVATDAGLVVPLCTAPRNSTSQASPRPAATSSAGPATGS